MIDETWRAIPDYEGFYEVSDLGRVRSVDRILSINGRWGSETRRYMGKVLAPCRGGTNKYLMTVLTRHSEKKTFTVHSLALLAFVGPCPLGQEVRHLDCDTYNNRLGNLCYGSRATNREDSRIAGTLAIGERVAQHKLTAIEVLEIRSRRERHEDIAAAYGVSRGQISRIKRRGNWRHV